ncbi:hypothetical protein BDP27DRAFT_346800 [Rhodocollybia butyracea]|uniref:Uncharacterized protein n=1 Tax=Rhodocollybia butyracea TaxID=206335 RepID=A0A9P5Q4B2_9AGAR|nr:hypothetical protein BDP27DRAFT_346800 [Rhodocollybia butyracea]
MKLFCSGVMVSSEVNAYFSSCHLLLSLTLFQMEEHEQTRVAGDWFASSQGFSINNSVLINYGSHPRPHSAPLLRTSDDYNPPNPYPSPTLTPPRLHSSFPSHGPSRPFYPSHASNFASLGSSPSPPDSNPLPPSLSPNAYILLILFLCFQQLPFILLPLHLISRPPRPVILLPMHPQHYSLQQ